MIIVQARMGSKRLPGKILKEIGGKPLIGFLIDRLLMVPYHHVIALPELFPHVDENDVAGRFREVLKLRQVPWFVRVCADSPLLDPKLVRAAIDLYERTGAKLVSNPGYPHGQQVEVIDTQYFLEREPLMKEAWHREHVTPFLYENAKAGEWVQFHCNRDMRFDVSLAVDTQKDFDRMERVIKRMDRPHTSYNWMECMQLAWEEANG
jgi:spore coat polysaccharide biosynthesis protein SpsF (cytidylyltransferase family)